MIRYNRKYSALAGRHAGEMTPRREIFLGLP
jgi:hypothetical protein